MKPNHILALVGLNGAAATILASMGSHGLHLHGSDAALFQQANEFHFYHTLALLTSVMLAKWECARSSTVSALLFSVGIICFSGSLYWRAVYGPGSLGSFHWVTPIGGLLLITAWITVTVGAIRSR